jgi:hypothetical protein
MAGLYVIEFFIHAFYSPDLDVFNGLKCDLALLSTNTSNQSACKQHYIPVFFPPLFVVASEFCREHCISLRSVLITHSVERCYLWIKEGLTSLSNLSFSLVA